MENRARRDNIRVVGLKEGAEGVQPVAFFERWLPEILKLDTKRGVIKIDRAHRGLGPARDDRPRPVIIKLHNSGDKQRIMAVLRQLTHEGQKLYIQQDMRTSDRNEYPLLHAVPGCSQRHVQGRETRFPVPLSGAVLCGWSTANFIRTTTG